MHLTSLLPERLLHTKLCVDHNYFADKKYFVPHHNTLLQTVKMQFVECYSNALASISRQYVLEVSFLSAENAIHTDNETYSDLKGGLYY